MILDLTPASIAMGFLRLLAYLAAWVAVATIGCLAALGGWHVYHDFLSR